MRKTFESHFFDSSNDDDLDRLLVESGHHPELWLRSGRDPKKNMFKSEMRNESLMKLTFESKLFESFESSSLRFLFESFDVGHRLAALCLSRSYQHSAGSQRCRELRRAGSLANHFVQVKHKKHQETSRNMKQNVKQNVKISFPFVFF